MAVALNELHESNSIDAALLAECQVTAAVSGVDLVDAKRCRGLLDRGDAQQVARRIRQQPEAIDELYLQFPQVIGRLAGGNALVEDQAQMHVGHEILGQ